ncbi:MAG: hypothetical protein ACTHNU_11785 [Gaiellales bacterium]
MHRRNVESDIRAFWVRYVKGRGRIAAAVRVEQNGETKVRIQDGFPYLPFFRKRGRPSFRVSMTGFLTSTHFGPSATEGSRTARGKVNRNQHKSRGRVVFLTLIDSDGNEEELAALLFHIDDASEAPVILRAVALRTDSTEMNDFSRAGAGWLLAYLVEVSRQHRQIEEVGADEGRTGNVELLRSLGFRPRMEPRRLPLVGQYLAYRPPFTTAG